MLMYRFCNGCKLVGGAANSLSRERTRFFFFVLVDLNNRTNENTTGKKPSLKDKRKSPPSKQPTASSQSPPSGEAQNIQVVINGHTHESGQTRVQSVTAKKEDPSYG